MSDLSAITDLQDRGWTFSFSDSTRYLEASHPRGGKMSVLEIRRPEFLPFGHAIAKLLNDTADKRPVGIN